MFYGWRVIGVIMLGGFLGAGMSQLFMGVMLKPMTEDLGWTRTAISGAITSGTVVAGLLAPIFGRLADRFGPRGLITAGALLVGCAYFLMAGLSSLSPIFWDEAFPP
jgi:MFS family permease